MIELKIIFNEEIGVVSKSYNNKNEKTIMKISTLVKSAILIGAGFLFQASFASSSGNDNNIGQELYSRACAHCHAPDLAPAIKAPAAFDQKAWAERIAKAKQLSGPGTKYPTAYDYLLHQVLIGKGLMQHHGLCLDSNLPKSMCTDKNYIAAIKYMSQQKD